MLLAGATLLYVCFLAGGEWAESYLMRYGTFIPSRGDLGLKLNLLFFILPATVLLTLALSEMLVSRLGTVFDAMARTRSGRAPAIAFAILTVAFVMLVRVGVLRDSVLTDDENVYHFQAQLLASGRLYADSLPPPIRAFFDNQFIINNGRWFGMYFVGHPAILALALRTGVFEWVGAMEAALTLLLVFGIARRTLGNRVAVIAASLLTVSPFFVFLSATHLSQTTSTLFLSVFTYAALRLQVEPQAIRHWAIAAGALSMAFVTRPQIAVLLSAPFIVQIVIQLVRRRLAPGWGPPAIAGLILSIGATTFLWVNHGLTGNVLHTSYHAYWESTRPFHARTDLLYPFREVSQNLLQLNFWLLGWPLSLAFLPFFRRTQATSMLAAGVATTFAGLGILGVPTVTAVGPVYYAETIPALIVLTASGIERAVILIRETLQRDSLRNALVAAPIAGTLASLLAFVPFQAASLRLMADVTQAPYDLVASRGLNNALIFVRSLPAFSVAPGSWAYYHRNNHPDLTDPVLFVRDLGPERDKDLIRFLPDRTPFLMEMVNRDLVLRPLER